MNTAQALIDGLSAQWQAERSQAQMTLGKLIDRLEELPPDRLIESLVNPHSYRGYYTDLSFELNDSSATAAELLASCRSCMGAVFEGYKGGDFQMGRNTPVWVANYGQCGKKIMSLNDDGTFTLEDDE